MTKVTRDSLHTINKMVRQRNVWPCDATQFRRWQSSDCRSYRCGLQAQQLVFSFPYQGHGLGTAASEALPRIHFQRRRG